MFSTILGKKFTKSRDIETSLNCCRMVFKKKNWKTTLEGIKGAVYELKPDFHRTYLKKSFKNMKFRRVTDLKNVQKYTQAALPVQRSCCTC